MWGSTVLSPAHFFSLPKMSFYNSHDFHSPYQENVWNGFFGKHNAIMPNLEREEQSVRVVRPHEVGNSDLDFTAGFLSSGVKNYMGRIREP